MKGRERKVTGANRAPIRVEKESSEFYKIVKDTDGFWKIWSDAVERGYLKYLDEKKVFAKVVRGRREITILEKKVPGERETVKKAEESSRNEWSLKALGFLRKARGCEEVAHRLGMVHVHSNDSKAGVYIQENVLTMEKIGAKAGEDNWGNDLKNKVAGMSTGELKMQVANAMIIPVV